MIPKFPFDEKKRLLFLSFVLIAGLLFFPAHVLGAGTVSTENDTDRPGMDISHFEMNPADDESVCAKSCMDNPNCSAYTYVKAGVQGKNPVCWLKNGVPNAKSDSCCISGVKSTPDLKKNTDLQGTGIPLTVITPLMTISPLLDIKKADFGDNGQVIIDFEDLSSSGPGEGNQLTVSNQYGSKGVTFNYPYPVLLDYSKGTNPSKFQAFAHSGTKAIEQCYGKEFCNVPIVINFTSGQKNVKTWIGYSGIIKNMKSVIISAFDSSGKQVAKSKVDLQPGSDPIPVKIPLEVSSDNGDIYSVALYLIDANGALWATNNLAVDDIELSSAGSAPECGVTQPPIVSITKPANGIIRINKFNLEGTISTTGPLQSAQLTIAGSNSPKSLDLMNSNSVSPNGGELKASGITDMLSPGQNTITVKAQNCKGESQNSVILTFTPCDNTTEPHINIIYPNPSQPEITVRSDDDKQVINGTVSSPSKINGVQIKVISTLPAGGMKSFDISADEKGLFSMPLNETDLFKGPNKIVVSATSNEGCSGESKTNVTFEKRVLKCISGENFLLFDNQDKGDSYSSDNGWEYITHNPGCGTHGNTGFDTFFSSNKPLPFWAELNNVQLIRFQPYGVEPDDEPHVHPSGWGDYKVLYTLRGYNLANSLVEVEWHNTCMYDYSGKDLKYAISFIISIPEDMTEADFGEKLYNPSDTNPETHPGIIKVPGEFYILQEGKYQ